MMIRKDSIKAGDISFSNLVEIPSCPVDDLDRSDIIVFLTSSLSTSSKWKLVNICRFKYSS